MTFLTFVAVFVGLACLGVPLAALAVCAVLRDKAGPDEARDGPPPSAPAARPVDFSGTRV